MKSLIKYLLRLIANAAVLYFATQYLPGISVENDFVVAFTVVLVLSLYNALIKPIIGILTLPLNFITFGLFAFITNILVLYAIAGLIEGFEISSFLAAALLSVVLAVGNSILNVFFK
jgi:putative membrane protein